MSSVGRDSKRMASVSTRELKILVPATWTTEELEERLRRLREPAESAEQRAKSGARVEVQSRTLSRVALAVEQLDERMETLEADALGLAQKSELAELRAEIQAIRQTVDTVAGAAEDARAAVELAEKRSAQLVTEQAEAMKGKLRAIWGAIGGLKRWQSKEVTRDS